MESKTVNISKLMTIIIYMEGQKPESAKKMLNDFFAL